MADLESLIHRLIENRVQFVVVGGFAAMAHGVTILTQDVDICCPFTTQNLLRLQSALSDLDPVHRMTPKRLPLCLTKETCRGLKNLYLDTTWGTLDCLGEITGIGDFRQVKRQSVRTRLGAGACYILGIDALILAKQALGRPRDQQAVVQLKAIRRKQQ